METEDHPLKTVYYCPKQEASTQDWSLKSFKYYFIEGLWEVVERGEREVQEWMGEENSDRKKQKSLKPRSLEHPHSSLHPHRLKGYINKVVSAGFQRELHDTPSQQSTKHFYLEKLLLSCYKPFYSTLISDKRRLKSVGGGVRKNSLSVFQCLKWLIQ